MSETINKHIFTPRTIPRTHQFLVYRCCLDLLWIDASPLRFVELPKVVERECYVAVVMVVTEFYSYHEHERLLMSEDNQHFLIEEMLEDSGCWRKLLGIIQ